MIFIDSSGFIALLDARDSFYQRAHTWRNTQKDSSFITTNLVIIESLGWIRNKRGKLLAVEMGRNLYSGEGLKVERVTKDDEDQAWKLFQKTPGRGLSMIDCTTIIVMKRLKTKEIFTFDQDFQANGLTVVP